MWLLVNKLSICLQGLLAHVFDDKSNNFEGFAEVGLSKAYSITLTVGLGACVILSIRFGENVAVAKCIEPNVELCLSMVLRTLLMTLKGN